MKNTPTRPTTDEPISYGEVAYNVYAEKHDWRYPVSDNRMPKWEELPSEERDIFEATANAVLREVLLKKKP